MWTLMIAVILACSGGPTEGDKRGKGEAGGEDRGAPDPVTVVDVATAGPGSVADVLVGSAVVESEASADIVPEATGVVREIRHDEGDVVASGDILAILDNVTLGTGAARATAEVQRLEQQVGESRQLLSRGAISVREVEDLEYQLRSAQLSSREARKSYGSTRLTAPFAGVVAMRDVRVGELATSARPAFQIVDPDRLRVVAAIPERDLGRVAIEQPVRLVSAYDADVWTTGRVTRMAPVVDPSSGTFRVTVQVDDPQRLRPGQFVSVMIEVDRHTNVLVVPKQAVVYEDGLPVAYRVVDAPADDEGDADAETDGDKGPGWFSSLFGGADEPEDTDAPEDLGPRLVAERSNLRLGLVDDDWAEIVDGIQAGDQVITVGQSHLRDGGRVRIAPTVPEAAEAGAKGASVGGDEG